MEGTVTKSTGSWYQVETAEGKVWKARTRGKLRLAQLNTSNPVAVGDRVTLEIDPNYEDTARIISIECLHGTKLSTVTYCLLFGFFRARMHAAT